MFSKVFIGCSFFISSVVSAVEAPGFSIGGDVDIPAGEYCDIKRCDIAWEVGGQFAGLRCVFLLKEQADVELNTLYVQLKSQLSTKHQLLLRDAQRAWLTSRDNTLALNKGIRNGYQVEAYDIDQCNITEHRNQELRDSIQYLSYAN